MDRLFFDGKYWHPWKKEREVKPGEHRTITVSDSKTGEIFKIEAPEYKISVGKQGLLRMRLGLHLWLSLLKADRSFIDDPTGSFIRLLACELAKSERWIVEEVVYEHYDPSEL